MTTASPALSAAISVAALLLAAPASHSGSYDQFRAENATAMGRMMAGMAAHPSGDVDRDFVETMVPHHQGAIAMAQAELRYGRNEQLRRIAQEIIIDQQQEIAAMRLALGDALPPSAPAPTEPAAPAAPDQPHGPTSGAPR